MEVVQGTSSIHAALLGLAALDKHDLEAALRHILRTDASTLGIERVNFWLLYDHPPRIVCELAYAASTDTYESGAELQARDYPDYFRALREEKVIAASSASSDPRTREFADSYLPVHQIGAMLDVPVWVRSKLAGVLCHEHVGPTRSWTHEEQEFALALAQVVATTLEVRERQRAESGERREAFLSEATAVLAETLELEQIPAALARLALPFLGDWCVIDVLDGNHLRRVARAHITPTCEELLSEIERRYPPRLSSPHPTSRAIRSGEPVVERDLGDQALRSFCEDDEHLRLAKALGTETLMAVPLLARGRLLGAIAFGAEAPRSYGYHDVALARELARRTAIAIDNASLYRRAEEAIRLRDEFLSIASHELYTPITSLQLMLEGARQMGASDEALRRVYPIAERQTKRLAQLVEDLLNVSRIQAGRLHIRLEDVNLEEVVRDIGHRFTGQLARSRSELSIRARGPTLGRWDRSRLDQVVTNLLSNAIKFGEGRPIQVDIEGQADSARLVVTDHGIGVPPEREPFIFQRFERAVSSDKVGGLGLGLYIAHAIVTALGGSIGVGRTQGGGATFTVELPRTGPVQDRGLDAEQTT